MHPTPVDVLWILIASALVFVMRLGFAMLESGLVRSKNSINVSAKVLTDLGVALIAFWVVGFGIMFGTSWKGLWGTNDFLLDFGSLWTSLFFLFHAMFASTGATIVSGAVAERIRFSSYLLITLLFAAVIYPVLGHWVWGGSLTGTTVGWLGKLGFRDFAGSTVVHSTGGWVSLAVILILGPRQGHYNQDGSVNRVTGAGLQTSIFGTILLWFGWFGFNGGSTLALNDQVPAIILKTSFSGAAGMLTALFLGWRLRGYPDVSLLINGALAGLVGATASAPWISTGSSLIVGAISALVMLALEYLLDRWRIDDAVTAIPVHLGAGIWGTLAVGLFGDPHLLDTGLNWEQQTLIQLLGILACGAWAFGVTWGVAFVVNRFRRFRVTSADEAAGLNVIEHKASTELYDLFRTLEEQSRSGDLNLRAPVEPFTEVGQIASQYNKVMDRLQENLVAKADYLSILNNVHEGLFLIDSGGRIGPFYSSVLEEFLGSVPLAGANFAQVLSPLVNPAVMEPWKDFHDVLFNSQIDEQAVARLNPLRQVELWTNNAPGSGTTRHARFQFRRLTENGQVVRVMVILRDVSSEIELQKNLETQKTERESEMELFYRILHIAPELLVDFLAGFDQKSRQINLLMEAGQHTPQDVLKHTFRVLHGLKGEASLLDLPFLVSSIHDIENEIQALEHKPDLQNSDFLSLALKLGRFQETGRELSQLVQKLRNFQTNIAQADVKASHGLVSALEGLAQRTAGKLGKMVSLKTSLNFEGTLAREDLSFWQEILAQLVKNAIVHGIELPEERLRHGKNKVGQITLTAEVHDHYVVRAKDDGQGIDLEGLKKKALEKGYDPQTVAHWSRSDVVRFLFTGGVSTAPTITEDAGRGVGLSFVSSRLSERGGRIAVSFHKGHYLEFVLTLPQRR
ncbi:MAG: ammonium transporter [Spirochaetales bacterium]|nr:ammonium transporter [Spirochaetales bacterium]